MALRVRPAKSWTSTLSTGRTRRARRWRRTRRPGRSKGILQNRGTRIRTSIVTAGPFSALIPVRGLQHPRGGTRRPRHGRGCGRDARTEAGFVRDPLGRRESGYTSTQRSMRLFEQSRAHSGAWSHSAQRGQAELHHSTALGSNWWCRWSLLTACWRDNGWANNNG